jgi:DNA-binding NtrC family response regulator
LESELFGHEKGAFTDAKALKRGLAELADGGTLLLDEIGATPLDLQAKLLQFLETQEVRRVGGTEPVRVRTRVVAATNEDLGRRVRDHSFRADLFYRLDVASVRMPALREMPSAIAQLAEHFVRTLTSEARRSLPRLTPGSFALLREYDWPGNARELRNAVERALIFYEAGPFQVLPPVAVPAASTLGPEVVLEPGLTLEEVERRYLAAQLERTPDADLSTIARRLGISRKTLWERRRRYGL